MASGADAIQQLLEEYASSPVSVGRALGELLACHRKQFFSGALAIGQANPGGVAWGAHIGGFLAGMVLVWLFPKRRGARQSY